MASLCPAVTHGLGVLRAAFFRGAASRKAWRLGALSNLAALFGLQKTDQFTEAGKKSLNREKSV